MKGSSPFIATNVPNHRQIEELSANEPILKLIISCTNERSGFPNDDIFVGVAPECTEQDVMDPPSASLHQLEHHRLIACIRGTIMLCR